MKLFYLRVKCYRLVTKSLLRHFKIQRSYYLAYTTCLSPAKIITWKEYNRKENTRIKPHTGTEKPIIALGCGLQGCALYKKSTFWWLEISKWCLLAKTQMYMLVWGRVMKTTPVPSAGKQPWSFSGVQLHSSSGSCLGVAVVFSFPDNTMTSKS